MCFPLCTKCADEQCTECTHSDLARSWIGTYASPELDTALEVGYTVLQYNVVWSYSHGMVYDGNEYETGMNP